MSKYLQLTIIDGQNHNNTAEAINQKLNVDSLNPAFFTEQNSVRLLDGMSSTFVSHVPKFSPIDTDDLIYNRFVTYIHDPNFIRLGSNEIVRTTELTENFNASTGENISHTVKLPRFMRRLMSEYPNLGIIKRISSYGTIYVGIALSHTIPHNPQTLPLTLKSREDTWEINAGALLNNYKDSICAKMGLTTLQYQQMINLRLIYVVHDNKDINIDATHAATLGRLTEYVHIKIKKLKSEESSALLVNNDFTNTINQDIVLSTVMQKPVYTNRLKAAERTYFAGDKLERSINIYLNTINNLPILPYIIYPDIPNLLHLVRELKERSMYTNRQDMKKTQEDDSEPSEFINWDVQPDSDENYFVAFTQLPNS